MPYPAYEVYKGEGCTDVAANFEFHEPAQVPNYFVLEHDYEAKFHALQVGGAAGG